MITPLPGNCALESPLELHVGHEVLAAYLFEHIWGAKIIDRTAGLPADATYLLWVRDWQVLNPFTGNKIPVKSLPQDIGFSTKFYMRGMFPSLHSISSIYKINSAHLEPSLGETTPYLEGGNVLFWSHSGRQGAIIGVTTAILTLEKLKSLKYFNHKIIQEERSGNSLLDRYAAMWQLTLEAIAKQLEVSVDNLIVLEHHLEADGKSLCLHIDITVLLGPQNKVFLHSPSESKVSQLSGNGAMSDDVKNPKVLTENQAITDRNKKILEGHGFEVVPIEGYYEFEDGAIYFLNGLLFEMEKRHFFVTGAGCHASDKQSIPFKPSSECVYGLSSRFSQKMHEHGIDVVYVDLKKTPLDGGVHCLTTEVRSPSLLPPQAISITGMADEISTRVVLRVKEQAEVALEFVRLQLNEQSYQKKRCAVTQDKPLVMELKVPIGGCLATLWTNHMEYPRLQLLPGHPYQLFLDRNEDQSLSTVPSFHAAEI
ncbi:MAG: hypothetical protein RLZZ453_1153 [Chlamydiota bacterium]|jgi:hypothetical protein